MPCSDFGFFPCKRFVNNLLSDNSSNTSLACFMISDGRPIPRTRVLVTFAISHQFVHLLFCLQGNVHESYFSLKNKHGTMPHKCFSSSRQCSPHYSEQPSLSNFAIYRLNLTHWKLWHPHRHNIPCNAIYFCPWSAQVFS